ncbi:hypothetical protein WJX84_009225 [Apatococcus fuscideae]|uniref:EXS domain-containing protein n=1 Tax=Apatococcus fuscideae TaxID=2026836 RepID=A0AAW1SVN6_9CHLO
MERGRPQTNPLSFLEPAPSLEVAYPLEGNTKSQGSHLTLAGQPVGYGLQKPIFLAWTVICVGVIITCLLVSDPAHLDLFYIYYQPIIPILFMFWLWGVAVRIFERNHIRYDVCFSVKDQRYLLFSRQVFQVAGIVTTLVLTNTALFSYHCAVNQLRWAALHPPFMYTSVIAFFLLPVNFIFKEERMFFTSTFGKVVSPFREVSWADFLLADVLTSLSKPLSDAERGMCHLLAGSVMEPHSSDRMCGSASWFIPFGLSLPFAWRLLQCLRVYMDTGNRAQLFNALKYSTAFPVIILSSMNNHVVDEDRWDYFYKPLWLAAAFINSGYSITGMWSGTGTSPSSPIAQAREYGGGYQNPFCVASCSTLACSTST